MPRARKDESEPPAVIAQAKVERPEEELRDEGRREFEFARIGTEEVDAKQWFDALDHKAKMPEIDIEALDPSKEALEKISADAPGTFLGDSQAKIIVRSVKNPAEGTSLGFVGVFAEPASESDFAPGTLVLRLDEKQLEAFEDSVRRSRRPHERLRGSLRVGLWNVATNRSTESDNAGAHPQESAMLLTLPHQPCAADLGEVGEVGEDERAMERRTIMSVGEQCSARYDHSSPAESEGLRTFPDQSSARAR